MKLRYLFSTMLAAALVFAGCTKEEVETLDNLQLTPATYLSISENGGTVTLTVTATEAWEFVVDDNWPDVITREKDGTEKSRVPHWLAADKLSGGAGVTTVTFSASGVPYGREVELSIKAGDHTQFLMVRQGSLEASEATCQDVIDGPDGKTYIVQGVVTAIANTTYGNWYLKDDTGQIYIYGTVDDSGSYNWASFNIEVGDIVKVSGPKTTYGTTVELVDVSVLGVTKSLVEIIKPAGKDAFEVGKDGGKVEVRVAYKGNGVFVGVPDVDWISYDGMDYKAGEPTKIEPNPADTAIVKFVVAPNPGGAREGKVEISSHNSDGSSSNAAVISQEGGIIDATASEIIEGADKLTYRMSGYVGTIAQSKYGNYYLSDVSGEVYIYGTLDADGKGGNFGSLGINAGDIVTVVGPKTTYGSTVELVDVTVEKHAAVKDATVAEFLAAEESNTWYRLTGEITEIARDDYGNFYLKDEAGDTVYIYGCAAGYAGEYSSSKTFASLGLKVGDTITIVGTRSSYNGTPQVKWAFFVSKKSE